MFKHTLIAGALALGLTTIGATAAQAGGPDVVEKFHDEFSVEDEFLIEICGFVVTVDIDVSGTFRLWPDGRIQSPSVAPSCSRTPRAARR